MSVASLLVLFFAIDFPAKIERKETMVIIIFRNGQFERAISHPVWLEKLKQGSIKDSHFQAWATLNLNIKGSSTVFLVQLDHNQIYSSGFH